MTDNATEPDALDAPSQMESSFNFSTMKDKAINNGVLANGLKILSEVALSPGTSLLLDGQLKSGITHVAAGFIARRMLGLPGLLLVGANSYSLSVTGKSLLAHAQALAGKTDESLGNRVKKSINENKSLDEILATIAEDVEDKYHKHSNKT